MALLYTSLDQININLANISGYIQLGPQKLKFEVSGDPTGLVDIMANEGLEDFWNVPDGADEAEGMASWDLRSLNFKFHTYPHLFCKDRDIASYWSQTHLHTDIQTLLIPELLTIVCI